MKRRLRWALLCFLITTVGGCSYSLTWWHHFRVNRAIDSQDYSTALRILQRTVQEDPDGQDAVLASRQGGRIAHFDAKNYAMAVEFYKHVVLRSPDAEERDQAQKFIAQIYFENLLDYDQAVSQYEKLLKLPHLPNETFRFRLNLAKSQLHLNNIDKALNEIDMLVTQKHSPDEIFEAKIIQANTLIAAKRLPEAVVLWESIIKEFPDKSLKENVALNLVVCYEEMREFGKAIEVLERMRKGYPHPDFLDLRIQRLKERKLNQPGAQGLRR